MRISTQAEKVEDLIDVRLPLLKKRYTNQS